MGTGKARKSTPRLRQVDSFARSKLLSKHHQSFLVRVALRGRETRSYFRVDLINLIAEALLTNFEWFAWLPGSRNLRFRRLRLGRRFRHLFAFLRLCDTGVSVVGDGSFFDSFGRARRLQIRDIAVFIRTLIYVRMRCWHRSSSEHDKRHAEQRVNGVEPYFCGTLENRFDPFSNPRNHDTSGRSPITHRFDQSAGCRFTNGLIVVGESYGQIPQCGPRGVSVHDDTRVEWDRTVVADDGIFILNMRRAAIDRRRLLETRGIRVKRLAVKRIVVD